MPAACLLARTAHHPAALVQFQRLHLAGAIALEADLDAVSGQRIGEEVVGAAVEPRAGDDVVAVLGKGRKQRIVPVGSHARAALAAYSLDLLERTEG